MIYLFPVDVYGSFLWLTFLSIIQLGETLHASYFSTQCSKDYW